MTTPKPWLVINHDGSLQSVDWYVAETLAERYLSGLRNPETLSALVAVSVREHLLKTESERHELSSRTLG